ncbi:uncharacterized protein M421DRAFT_76081 [Didymella exigua CBS 183.55]|uniref:DUF7730 domain-containing protein n=1 Tax=Didymella exigua CBS 183.55 TaxID=1150837 RepID=A0A6A5R4U8_9PLEO|nr:uncharacterized protein M421DRAFT_76081 [Didymella exigua CBS 183.55]KAF1923131.1 hypothetical protein M421DRAFT_76081 [Didymella exigua CBS 183.55]
MARPTAGKALGKRTRRSTAEQQDHVGPARASKRLREKRETSAGRNGPTYAGPSTTTRNGPTTTEPNSLTESQTSLPRDDTPLARRDIFAFMQLPAELRIHIYHMALHRTSSLFLHAARVSQDEDPPPDDTCPLMPAPTCAAQVPARRPRAPSPPLETLSPLEMPYPPDPVVPTILRLNQQIYKEARSVLYSNNTFTLSLSSGIHTLSTLHQRSRSLIKHVILTIPSHHDILDGFADLVRLGLRYCWGLKTFKIILQASLPDDGRMSHATSVYANAFHILRWLPRGCKVVLEGNVSEVVRDVVREEGRLQIELDEAGYAKRQHQMPERH